MGRMGLMRLMGLMGRIGAAGAFARGFGDGLQCWIAEGQQYAPRAIRTGLVQLRKSPPECLRAKIIRPISPIGPMSPIPTFQAVQKRRDIDEPRAGIHKVKVEQLPSIHGYQRLISESGYQTVGFG